MDRWYDWEALRKCRATTQYMDDSYCAQEKSVVPTNDVLFYSLQSV